VTGDVDPSGATDPWEIYVLYVGQTGEGTLNIESGGMVSNTDGYIGGGYDSVGTVTVTGEGSEWNNWGKLTVGSAGDGTLNMIDGGVVSSCYICYIGELPGSVGSVTVAGEGSRWSNSGDLYVGHEGDGRLATPNKNNTVTVSGRIFVLLHRSPLFYLS